MAYDKTNPSDVGSAILVALYGMVDYSLPNVNDLDNAIDAQEGVVSDLAVLIDAINAGLDTGTLERYDDNNGLRLTTPVGVAAAEAELAARSGCDIEPLTTELATLAARFPVPVIDCRVKGIAEAAGVDQCDVTKMGAFLSAFPAVLQEAAQRSGVDAAHIAESLAVLANIKALCDEFAVEFGADLQNSDCA